MLSPDADALTPSGSFDKISRRPAVDICITGGESADEINRRLVEMMFIGVNFARHFGTGIPTEAEAVVPPSASLQADVAKFAMLTDFEGLYALYLENGGLAVSLAEAAWMLRQFPDAARATQRQLAGDPAELLQAYRRTITFEQCEWLLLELLAFGTGFTCEDLLTPGRFPFQDNVLTTMHRSADAHNDAALDAHRFEVWEAAWLALHLNDESNDSSNAVFRALLAKVVAHCEDTYVCKAAHERQAYQTQLNSCKTPGQLLQGSGAKLSMAEHVYPYHLRPLFRRAAEPPDRDARMKASTEITGAANLKVLTKTPYAAVLELWYQASCVLQAPTGADVDEDDYHILYPTRRPWTESRGRAIRLAHARALLPRWPRKWHALRSHVPTHVWMQVPCCVSSMWYFAHLQELAPLSAFAPARARPAAGGGGGAAAAAAAAGASAAGAAGEAAAAAAAAKQRLQAAALERQIKRTAETAAQHRAKFAALAEKERARTAAETARRAAGAPAARPAAALQLSWPHWEPPRMPSAVNMMRGGIDNPGASCYANSTFQILFRSAMARPFMTRIHEMMTAYTTGLRDAWTSQVPAKKQHILRLARQCADSARSDERYAAYPQLRRLETWAFFVTEVYMRMQLLGNDAAVVEVLLDDMLTPLGRQVIIFAALSAMCRLYVRMQLDAVVHISEILALMGLALRGGPDASREDIWSGKRQCEADELFVNLMSALEDSKIEIPHNDLPSDKYCTLRFLA
jgi:hypothetical protein